MKNLFWFCACLGIVLFSACKKCYPPGPVCTDNAVIYYPPANITDVCRLSIAVGGASYLPLNLDSSFLADTLKVKMCYTLTGDSAMCGFTNRKYPYINIKSIERR